MLILLSFLIGCGARVKFDDVIGVYALRYPYGTEELTLRRNGTYIQSGLIDGERTPKVNRGRWKFNERESEVVLIDAMTVDDFFGHLRPEYWRIEPGHYERS